MKTLTVVAGVVLLVVGAGIAGAQDAQAAGKAVAGQSVKRQTVCPVMGGQVNTNLFVDYDGSRVYLCCTGCPAEFKKTPAKYVAKLEKDGVTLDRAPTADSTQKQATGVADTVPAKDQGSSAAKGSGGCCK